MKIFNIDLDSTPECKRPLSVDRKLHPFYGVVELRFFSSLEFSSSFKMIDLNDDYVVQSFSNGDCYEPFMLREWISRVLVIKGAVLDIGASTGLYSLVSSSFNRKVKVYAFEPYSRASSRLVNNKEINSFPKIFINPYAVGSFERISTFSIKNFEGPITTGGSIDSDAISSDVLVQVKVIDDVIPVDERIGLIKIDVEGQEIAVLSSLKQRLIRDRPDVFFESLELSSFVTLFDFFMSIGAKVYCLSEKTKSVQEILSVPDFLVERNFLAIF